MGGVPLVLWTFSHPGDLNFDASIADASSAKFLGSNQIAATRRGGSSVAFASSSAHFAALAFGRAWVAGLRIGKVSDSLLFRSSALLKVIIIKLRLNALK